ncbi:hypothetical protein QVD17_12377 [Tagetes erecta]|uniref:Uncharacterized protein n=1 Tax=Tagetes erecta TaxID=13708 RepID=A0AAD8KYX7_TARER|nr:hypothetical protein QVD17_12377 [Tagetes erecta]
MKDFLLPWFLLLCSSAVFFADLHRHLVYAILTLDAQSPLSVSSPAVDCWFITMVVVRVVVLFDLAGVERF